MTENLLTKIQREMNERLHELRGAVEEHDRLAGELRTLDAAPEPPSAPRESVALEVVPRPRVASEAPEVVPEPRVASEASEAPEVVPEPSAACEPSAARELSANVVRLPARPCLPRTRTVSSKAARLMRPPRRPSLERHGLVLATVSAHGRSSSEEDLLAVDDDLCPGVDPVVGIDEVDVEAEAYERSL